MTQKPYTKIKKSEPSVFGKLYLIAYNCIQTLGWSYMLYQTASHFLNRGTLDTYWSEVKYTVVIFQNAAILEVLHAAVGLVPSGVFLTLAQVYSRVYLVLGALLATEAATLSPGLPICVIAWSITEIIRYAYYALNLVKMVPQFLLVLRYSTFLVLYPLGITGELLCMYHALDEVAERKLFSVALPNSWNVVFNYYYFIIVYMLLYIPMFPVLFGHMVSQRNKMLGGELKKKV